MVEVEGALSLVVEEGVADLRGGGYDEGEDMQTLQSVEAR